MAVVLCRSNGKALPTPPGLRGAPRVTIKNEPVSTVPSHHGKKITARSAKHYACAEPQRKVVWKENFERRKVQQTSCGFHGAGYQPYQDVGQVVLDDRTLILEGLGQHVTQETQSEEKPPSPEKSPSPPSAPISPVHIQFRNKTPSQYPTELMSLTSQLKEVEDREELVKRGRGLFTLMKNAEEEKRSAAQNQAEQEALAQQNEWKEANIDPDDSLHDTDEHLSPWQPTVQDDGTSQATKKTSYAWNGVSSVASEFDKEGEEEKTEEVEERKEKENEEEEEKKEERGEEQHHTNVIDQWYRQLCVLVWVLQSMRMDNPAHMTPLYQCWRIDRPPPNETLGRRVTERNKGLMQQWEAIVKQQTKKPRSKQPPGRPTRQHTSLPQPQDHMTPQNSRTRGHTTSHDPRARGHVTSHDPLAKQQRKTARVLRSPGGIPSLEEEQKIRRQRKLTSSQMEGLVTLVEEELNFSKKQSRSQIKAFVADQAKQQRDNVPPDVSHPVVSLSMEGVTQKFSAAKEHKDMIVHEQLTAMERDRHKALQQRFTSLQVSGNIWQDLAVMREGVEIETTAMARRRLLMNYEWYSDLLSLLPVEVKGHCYCQQLLTTLQDLSHYMRQVGPQKMSKKRLMQVLGSLRPWELRNPDIAAAVEFLCKRVIYIVAEDYEKWLNWHTHNQHQHPVTH